MFKKLNRSMRVIIFKIKINVLQIKTTIYEMKGTLNRIHGRTDGPKENSEL